MGAPAIQFDLAQAHIRKAEMLASIAQATRDAICARRRRCPVRRRCGLARGGVDMPLAETDRPRCPHCEATTITPAGRGVARSGTIYVESRCERCGQSFLLLYAPERHSTHERG